MSKNAKLSGSCFYMNTNIKRDFQICISVPLINHETSRTVSATVKVSHLYKYIFLSCETPVDSSSLFNSALSYCSSFPDQWLLKHKLCLFPLQTQQQILLLKFNGTLQLTFLQLKIFLTKGESLPLTFQISFSLLILFSC